MDKEAANKFLEKFGNKVIMENKAQHSGRKWMFWQ
ncbi:MAG: hypothetical protein ACI865_003441 [Flavobacteriaceae bacterium]|jgi:hypothetical protein